MHSPRAPTRPSRRRTRAPSRRPARTARCRRPGRSARAGRRRTRRTGLRRRTRLRVLRAARRSMSTWDDMLREVVVIDAGGSFRVRWERTEVWSESDWVRRTMAFKRRGVDPPPPRADGRLFSRRQSSLLAFDSDGLGCTPQLVPPGIAITRHYGGATYGHRFRGRQVCQSNIVT